MKWLVVFQDLADFFRVEKLFLIQHQRSCSWLKSLVASISFSSSNNLLSWLHVQSRWLSPRYSACNLLRACSAGELRWILLPQKSASNPLGLSNLWHTQGLFAGQHSGMPAQHKPDHMSAPPQELPDSPRPWS